MTYSLVADGSSDSVVLPILTWSLKQHGVQSVVAQWVDFGRIPRQRGLRERLSVALDLYPCDLLFVHRDAESQPSEYRRREITEALPDRTIRHVPVVPIRMTEAWLLSDEQAIRSAAGNPNGTEPLGLPAMDQLENLPDPKRVLFEALGRATGLNARRRAEFPVRKRIHQIPNYMDDYTRLRALRAFRDLQDDIAAAIVGLT